MSTQPLVPDFIVKQHSLQNTSGQLQAAVQFVDISGFTALTEELMTHGKEGAEVLGKTLQFYFDPLVRAVSEAGGFITGFAGDAFTAVYPSSNSEDIALRVLQAAWKMQDFFLHHGQFQNQFGTFQFAVKVGLSWGTVDWGIVDTSRETSTYFFRGEGIDGSANSEKHASKGDIILDPAFVGELESPEGSFFDDGYLCFSGQFEPEELLEALPQTPAEGDISRFVPEDISSFPREGEFRRVSVVFLSFEEVEDLEGLARSIQSGLHRFGGTFTRIDFGDKGGNCLVFFGVPTAHENNEERALNFAMELMESQKDSTRLRAGITQNIMYAGFNGGIDRYEFACLGRAVNMAARLMMKAEWGQIWCSPKIKQRTNARFSFSSLGDFPLKGFAAPVPLFRLDGQQDKAAQRLQTVAMIGREGELTSLAQGISLVFSNHFAGAFYIDGEAGMGKSYLVAACRKYLEQHADGLPYDWIYAPCDQTLQGSLHPFVYALKRYTNQSYGLSQEQSRDAFEAAMRELKASVPSSRTELRAELDRVHSFLAALVGIRIPGSLYEQLEPRLRFSNTLSALHTWLEAQCTLSPLILQVEDAHWMDNASNQALRQILHKSHDLPIAVLMTCRYMDDGAPFRLNLQGSVPQNEININHLSRQGLQGMCQNILGQEVHERLLDLLEEKARGNPFFVEQIIGFLKENDALQEVDGKLAPVTTDVILPEEVNSVLVARLDRLEPSIRNLVQRASIFGREFSLPLLERISDSPESVKERVEQAVQAQIWLPVGSQRYMFKHALMRDAAYDMQARARLRELHLRAAEAFEAEFAHDLAPHYGELAYHFERADIRDKTIDYLEKAGDEARKEYRNQEALDYYERLLQFLPESGELPRRVYLSLAQVMQVLGNIDEGLEHVEKAEAALPNSAPQVRYQKAFLTQMKGDFVRAGELIREAIGLAQEASNREWEARCLNSLGVLNLYTGEPETAGALLTKSMSIAREEGLQAVEVKAISNMAGVAMAHNNLDEARQHLEQSLAIARELKDRWTEFLCLGNLGELYLKLSSPEKALTSLEQSKDVGTEIGTQNAAFLANYAESLRLLGRLNDAETNLDLAEKLAQASGNKKHLITVSLSRGELLHQRGDTEAALSLLAEAAEMAESSNQKALLARVEALIESFRSPLESSR